MWHHCVSRDKLVDFRVCFATALKAMTAHTRLGVMRLVLARVATQLGLLGEHETLHLCQALQMYAAASIDRTIHPGTRPHTSRIDLVAV